MDPPQNDPPPPQNNNGAGANGQNITSNISLCLPKPLVFDTNIEVS